MNNLIGVSRVLLIMISGLTFVGGVSYLGMRSLEWNNSETRQKVPSGIEGADEPTQSTHSGNNGKESNNESTAWRYRANSGWKYLTGDE